MALLKLDFASIADLDGGRVAAALQRELKRAVNDCRDRPNVAKPRKVNLIFEVSPPDEGPDQSGDMDAVKMAFSFQNAFPARRATGYRMRVQRNGELVFNDFSPDNPRQRTIDELEGGPTT